MDSERFGKCPFYTTQRLIQGKWAILILHYLSEGPLRFNELQRKMPKMTHATLSNQLKQLEAEGLIARKVYGDIPPKVEYSLTELGRAFGPVLYFLDIALDFLEHVPGFVPWVKTMYQHRILRLVPLFLSGCLLFLGLNR